MNSATTQKAEAINLQPLTGEPILSSHNDTIDQDPTEILETTLRELEIADGRGDRQRARALEFEADHLVRQVVVSFNFTADVTT